MKNPINMTPQELIENGFDGPLRPCVTKLINQKYEGEKIFGAFKIGKLRPTKIHFNNLPVFLTENDELVYCTEKMAERIEERLNQLKMGV